MSYDAVLSYHLNPQTCGVAKFNQELARRLGVPCLPLSAPAVRPLVSVKLSETREWVGPCITQYDLLLHDRPSPEWTRFVQGAGRVFYADELGCPSTIHGNPDRGTYRVLAFGMAHKLGLQHFRALKTQLDVEHPGYTVSLSTAVHEGSPWDDTLQSSVAAMREIFGDRLRVLGYLADDALARELQECDAVAVYFDPALRANNTTYWAAIEAGKPIYTNRDAQSPQPDDPPVTWDRLLEVLSA